MSARTPESVRPTAPVRLIILRILVAVEQGGNSSLLLEHARFAAEVDRGLATELLFGTLRRRGALDGLAAQVCSRPIESLGAVVRCGIRLGIYQMMFLDRIPAYAAVGETVEAVKHAAGHREASFVNGVLRGFERRRGDLKLPGPGDVDGYLTMTLSLPAALAGRWRERFGDAATVALAEAALRPAEVMLRVQGARTTVPEAVARLAGDGVLTRSGQYLEETLVVESGGLATSGAFREGLVVVQDEAAQMVARLLAPEAGHRILDACAAPGGKTCAIADLARGEARIFAGDLRPGRLRMVRQNVQRSGSCGVRLVIMDAIRPPFSGEIFDRILVDAPCTGTGTIRRNPELRDRASAEAALRSGARAAEIVVACAANLAPGGRLVYATCSLEPEENEDVIEQLLARDRGLMRGDPRPYLPERAQALVGADLALRTWPAAPDLDGFTAFVIERRNNG